MLRDYDVTLTWNSVLVQLVSSHYKEKDWFLVLILALNIKLWRLTSFVICSFFSKYANTKMLQRLKVNFVGYLWYIYEAIDMFYTKARYLCDRHWYSRGVAQLFSYIAIYFIGWAEMWLRYIQGHFHFLIYHIWRQKGLLQINHFQLNFTSRYIIMSFLNIGYWTILRSYIGCSPTYVSSLCFPISGKACDDHKIKIHESFSRLVATDHMHHKCAVTAIFPHELRMLNSVRLWWRHKIWHPAWE